MKLTGITIDNVLGARSAHIETATPITLIAGRNGAGKSSIAEAVRQALGLDPERVALKKDFGKLITDGAKNGVIAVQFGEASASLTLPAGKLSASPELEHFALPFVIDPRRFSGMDETERRAFLFKLMGVKISGKAVAEKLKARGLNDEYCAQVQPMLAAGFDAAATEAQTKARDAKAAWRAITGETYGEKKADGWKIEADDYDPEQLDQANVDLQQTDQDVEEASRALGALEAGSKQAASRASDIKVKQEVADMLPRIRTKLDVDTKEAERLRGIVAEAKAHKTGQKMPCPCCGVMLQLVDGALSEFKREAGDDTAAEAAEDLGKWQKALELVESAIRNGQRDLAAAEQAAADLQKLKAEPASEANEAAIAAAKAKLEQLKDERRTADATVQRLRTAKQAAEHAESKTKAAAQHHADVIAWGKIADALSPEGIQAELLADALAPFNDTLAALTPEEWPAVKITDTISIEAGGRPYGFRSKSEQWRVDAVIAAAIAHVAGLHFVMLDEFDLLDAPARGEALYWLDDLAARGFSALVLGTLKAVPQGLPETIGGHWIEAGVVGAEVAA